MRSGLVCAALLSFGMGIGFAAGPANVPAVSTVSQQAAGARSAGAQAAQSKDGGYRLKASTKLVVLDVMVKDAKGNPVTGLRKEDFHVTEAKQPQTILNFEAAESHAIAPEVTVHSTAELDKAAPDAPVNIILLDEINTRFEEMAKARRYLAQYLAAQPERLAMPTMLVVASIDASETQHNLKVISDYTQDRQALEAALAHYVPRYPFESESLGIEFNRNRLGERFGLTFSTLEKIAEAAKSHSGHKNIIWVGAGFPKVGTALLDGLANLFDRMQRCVDALREARVTLYSINPQGETGYMTPGSGTGYMRSMDGTTTALFYDLVEDTGGTAHYMYNDIDAQIGESARDGADFYTIAYRPTTESQAPGKLRKIAVMVDRAGVTVAANKGYALPYQPTSKEAILLRRSSMLHADTSQMVYNGVPVTVTRLKENGDQFAVKVEPPGLVWTSAENGEQRAELGLVASTFDAHGRELKRVAKKIHAVRPEGQEPGAITLPLEIAHDAKAVRVRVVVRIEETERMGSADVVLKQ